MKNKNRRGEVTIGAAILLAWMGLTIGGALGTALERQADAPANPEPVRKYRLIDIR